MDYELAKKLKDAGFPQRDGWKIGDNPHKEPKEIHLPTLSELIEACGEDFTSLDRWEEKGKAKWQAEWKHLVFGHGSTPIEAVANLWLALNNK